jgi:hypothetical protein
VIGKKDRADDGRKIRHRPRRFLGDSGNFDRARNAARWPPSRE